MNEIETDFYTLADAAAILGKKTDTLKKWFKNGCPHRKAGRVFEVRIADVFAWRLDYERQLAQGAEGEEGPLVLEHERAKLAREQRIGQAMANQVRRGELVEAEEVERAWGDMVGAAKAKLLGIGAKVGARIGGKGSRKIKAAIDEEVRKALAELTRDD